jgi:hypothetical protein
MSATKLRQEPEPPIRVAKSASQQVRFGDKDSVVVTKTICENFESGGQQGDVRTQEPKGRSTSLEMKISGEFIKGGVRTRRELVVKLDPEDGQRVANRFGRLKDFFEQRLTREQPEVSIEIVPGVSVGLRLVKTGGGADWMVSVSADIAPYGKARLEAVGSDKMTELRDAVLVRYFG